MRTVSAIIAAALAAVTLAACGSDAPKVSSSEYLTKCQDELSKKLKEQAAAANISDSQVADICKCTQDKLVARGDGDKQTDDNSLTEELGQNIGRECAAKVLAGG